MPIVFAPLVDSPETLGDLVMELPPLRFFAAELPQTMSLELPALQFAAVGTLADHGDLIMTLPPLEFLGTNVEVGIETTYTGMLRAVLPPVEFSGFVHTFEAPQSADLIMELPSLEFSATGFAHTYGDLVMPLPPLQMQMFDSAGNHLIMTLPSLQFTASQVVVIPSNYMTLLAQPIMSVLGSTTMGITSNLQTTDVTLQDVLFVLNSRLEAGDSMSTLAKFIIAIESNLIAQDAFRFVLDMIINETLDLDDEFTITPEAILALSSQLMLQDETMGLMTAIVTITSSLVLLDRVRADQTVTITSAVALADVVTANLTLITTLVSDAMLLAETSGLLFASALVSSALVLDDGVEGFITALMSLEDGAHFAVRFSTPEGDEFVGYVLNTRNAAIATLPDHPFNSMAVLKLGGKQLTIAAGKDGVYTFGGDTFDGEPINASVRLGLNDFGTSALKHVANAFVGYTSDGELRLIAITTDGGRKKENWYKLKARSAQSVVDGRIDIAKGLTARYWGWEIENIEGANFQLDQLQVWPMIIQRRKSGR